MMQMQQRAFLASAVQQNLQIQQQLMQQSAALQQLLQSSVIGGASSPGQSAEEVQCYYLKQSLLNLYLIICI